MSTAISTRTEDEIAPGVFAVVIETPEAEGWDMPLPFRGFAVAFPLPNKAAVQIRHDGSLFEDADAAWAYARECAAQLVPLMERLRP
jgi:hypothetical protein